MRHQHQISGLKPLVMNGMVVNVTEDGLSSQPVCRVVSVDVLAKLVHQLNAGFLLGGDLTLLETIFPFK